MKAFVDTSAWFGAANTKDRHHLRASELLDEGYELITSTFTVVEAWLLLRNKVGFSHAEAFLTNIVSGAAVLENVIADDIEKALKLDATFPDQEFSFVDRTSFVIMERLAISKAISFDSDFLIYRFGANRDRAFEVLR